MSEHSQKPNQPVDKKAGEETVIPKPRKFDSRKLARDLTLCVFGTAAIQHSNTDGHLDPHDRGDKRSID